MPRRTLITSFAILLITAGLFLALEGIARFILWETTLITPADTPGFGYGAGGLGDLRPNLDVVEMLYPIRPYWLHTNSVGLRNVDEVDPDPAVFRVLAVGDSFTYGIYVHNHETYPARLEEHLNQRGGRRRFQVFNAGVPGYTVEDTIAYLRDKGLALEPDLVVLGFYTNDIFDFYPPVRALYGRSVALENAGRAVRPISPLRAALLEHLALFNLWHIWRGSDGTSNFIDINRVTPTIEGLGERYRHLTFLDPDHPDYAFEWNQYEQSFRELAALLAAEGIPLILVAFPDLAQLPPEGGLPSVPQAFLARLTADTGTAYLDLLPVYRAVGDVQSLYLMYFDPDQPVDPDAPDAAVMAYVGDGHPSAYGHLIAARALVDLLAAEGLAPINP